MIDFVPMFEDQKPSIAVRYRKFPLIINPAHIINFYAGPPLTDEEIRQRDLRTKFRAVKLLLVLRYNLDAKRRHEHAANISKLEYIPCVGGCGLKHANYIDPDRTHVSEWCCARCHRRICGDEKFGEWGHSGPCKLREEE